MTTQHTDQDTLREQVRARYAAAAIKVGRLRLRGITDVVAENHLTPSERAERGAWVGCVAGALSKSEYQAGLAAAGFEQVSVTFTHQVGDGLHPAIVRAIKPPSAS